MDDIKEEIKSMQFRITFRNQVKALEFTFFLLLFTIGCLFYFRYSDPFFNTQIFVWLFIIQLAPVLYLHFEYLALNWRGFLIANKDLKTIQCDQNGRTLLNLNFNQIGKIILYLPPSTYRGIFERKMQFLPIEPYGTQSFTPKMGTRQLLRH